MGGLEHFDNYYLLVLKTTHIYSKKDEQYLDGFSELIDWMQNEFVFSTIGIAFALNIFRQKKLPKMMKYKQKHTIKERKSDLINMTWDLYVMYDFFHRLNNKESNIEYLVVSADKFFRAVLKTSINIYSLESINNIKMFVDKNDYALVDCFIQNYNPKNNNRIYNKLSNDDERIKHKRKLIEELENILLS